MNTKSESKLVTDIYPEEVRGISLRYYPDDRGHIVIVGFTNNINYISYGGGFYSEEYTKEQAIDETLSGILTKLRKLKTEEMQNTLPNPSPSVSGFSLFYTTTPEKHAVAICLNDRVSSVSYGTTYDQQTYTKEQAIDQLIDDIASRFAELKKQEMDKDASN